MIYPNENIYVQDYTYVILNYWLSLTLLPTVSCN